MKFDLTKHTINDLNDLSQFKSLVADSYSVCKIDVSDLIYYRMGNGYVKAIIRKIDGDAIEVERLDDDENEGDSKNLIQLSSLYRRSAHVIKHYEDDKTHAVPISQLLEEVVDVGFKDCKNLVKLTYDGVNYEVVKLHSDKILLHNGLTEEKHLIILDFKKFDFSKVTSFTTLNEVER